MQCLVLQFERTLIVADEDSQVSYLEGCTAPSYDKNQVKLKILRLRLPEDYLTKLSLHAAARQQ